MSLHLDAKLGEISETVLLPGDPLRAKFIAEKFLDNAHQYNTTRNMLGFTGTYMGKIISIQGTGMGCPSMGIYSHELINDYSCKRLIRIGTAGSFVPSLDLGDTLLVSGASYETAYAQNYRLNGTLSAVASFDLLAIAKENAKILNIKCQTGMVVTTDVFYEHYPDWWKEWQAVGVLAVEMETAALYMNAQTAGIEALSIVTISDNFTNESRSTAQEREKTFMDMVEIALNTAIS
jgi:purine-nucleoside phosphorylase